MTLLSKTEENYLKAVYQLSQQKSPVSTRSMARELDSKDSSVTDMIKKLSGKGLIDYQKYHGVVLTDMGRQHALTIIRRHRLWETFLVEKLNFNWDEVHDLAEQLEHIQSLELINRLDAFLNYPERDPHGDPIPDAQGNISQKPQVLLSEASLHTPLRIIRVKDDSSALLKYLDDKGLAIGNPVQVVRVIDYDQSLDICLSEGHTIHISKKVSDNIVVQHL